MATAHVLTGGLGYSPPGVAQVPTRGLTFPPGEPTTLALPASIEDTFALPASYGRTLALAASLESTFTLLANLVMAEHSTVTLWRGSDVNLIFTVPAGQVVTGLNIVFAMADRTARLEKTATVLTATTFKVALVAADTEGLTAPRAYTFDAWVRGAGGNVPLAYGSIQLKAEVPTS